MYYIMATNKPRKVAVSVTLDPDLHARCRRLAQAYDINWSQVARETFSGLADMLERAEAAFMVDGSDGASADLKAQLKSFYFDSLSSLSSLPSQSPSPELLSKAVSAKPKK